LAEVIFIMIMREQVNLNQIREKPQERKTGPTVPLKENSREVHWKERSTKGEVETEALKNGKNIN